MFDKIVDSSYRLKQKAVRNAEIPAYLLRGQFSTYYYVSHHKCATQSTIRVLKEVAKLLKLRTAVHDWRHKISRTSLFLNNLILVQDYSDGIIDINGMKERGFHVIRDPRDILVSSYFSHRDSHPLNTDALAHERRHLQAFDKQEGLRYVMDNSSYFSRVIGTMEAWDYSQPNFYETRFEALTTQPLGEYRKIFEFLGLELESTDLESIIEHNSFKHMRTSRINTGSKRTHHYRRGRAGDWRNHFDSGLKDIFKERYGKVLVHLGYEESNDW